MRVDLAGPATCFAFRRGLDTAEVRGACRADLDALVSVDGSPAPLSDAGTCGQPVPALPSCKHSPPASTPSDSGPDGLLESDSKAPVGEDAHSFDAGGDK
ncbi:hypothetical protein [Pendulispora albinea]|uniref:Uncharacterized protein n=1 Tax=Pendulispora albinea TaxID=2741071 RepID=A0ABZ2M6U0_9BACT